MAQQYILTLDMGSSGLRSLVAPVDRPWALTAEVGRPYRVYQPSRGESLARHFSPEELWRRLTGVLGDSLRASGVQAGEVAAVSVTAQRQAVAFLAADGATLYLGPNRDLRAVFEGAAIDERLAGQVYASTGHLPSLLFAPAKLHWWRSHHPRVQRRIHRVLTLGSWVAYRLTGEQADVASNLTEAGLADVAERNSSALLPQLDVDPALLPPLVEEGDVIGKVTAQAAQETGIPPGTPVVLAGPDTQTALLGMGVVAPAGVGVVSGWSTPVQMVTEHPVFDERSRTWAGLHVLPGQWVAEANTGDTGGALDVVRRVLGPRAKAGRLDRLASHSRLGSNMVTAFWGPQALDLANPGMAMGGLLMPIPLTYNAIHAGHVARATLENIAYAIRESVDQLAAVTGGRGRSLALSGGLAQSTIFPQLLADVLGEPVRLHHHRASAIGAAIAASVPRGQWEQAGKAAAARAALVAPDVRSALEYAELYERWLRLKARLQELSEEL